MNEVVKTEGKFILVEDAALAALEKSTEDKDLLSTSVEESALRQLLLRVLVRLDALEKR